VVQFCELTHTPFVVGLTGKYWVDETHPLYRGVYGFAGHESAKALLQEDVDLVLAVGAAMDELSTSGWDAHLLNSKLVHIDSNLEHFSRSPMANLHVGGDISAIFSALIRFVRKELLRGRRWLCCDPDAQANLYGGFARLQEPEKCGGGSTPVKPQELMYHLSQRLPLDTRIFIEAGNTWAWITHYYCNRSQLGHLRSGMGLGAMAWSIGAAVGCAIANPKAPTLCVVGDGAYLMSAQEITVAAQHQLPVVFMVLNDSAYGMVMHGQRLGGAEAVGWQLTTVDYAAMAQAMGVHSTVIHTTAELEQVDYAALWRRPGPTLIDVRLDREEVPPMAQRVRGLAATPGG
ncbi:MAG TPA: thiamine pyrophosphate-dependent enzyme, partial [Pseudoxanthomonas sp.]|nr:thiamine pyrophosphate-dependent enzyme [Pseudoxanthomonas sp.]